jgi:hypothetical protein
MGKAKKTKTPVKAKNTAAKQTTEPRRSPRKHGHDYPSEANEDSRLGGIGAVPPGVFGWAPKWMRVDYPTKAQAADYRCVWGQNYRSLPSILADCPEWIHQTREDVHDIALAQLWKHHVETSPEQRARTIVEQNPEQPSRAILDKYPPRPSAPAAVPAAEARYSWFRTNIMDAANKNRGRPYWTAEERVIEFHRTQIRSGASYLRKYPVDEFDIFHPVVTEEMLEAVWWE